MNLDDVAAEIATRLRLAPSLAGRTYDEPVGKIVAPAAIVGFPTDGQYDRSGRRGLDSMTVPVVVAVGRPLQTGTRSRLAGYIDGAGPESVHELLEGTPDDPYKPSSCYTISVAGWETDEYSFGDVPHLVVVFQVDITGPGEG